MSDAITRPMAQLMAALHPGWDIPGCATAIHKARHLAPLDQLAHAVITYAMRGDIRTPALLAEDGPHWHTGRTPDARVAPVRCAVHEHELASSCRVCAVERYDPTTAPTLALSETQLDTNVRGAALVRTALSNPGTRTSTPTVHVPDARSLAAGATKEDT